MDMFFEYKLTALKALIEYPEGWIGGVNSDIAMHQGLPPIAFAARLADLIAEECERLDTEQARKQEEQMREADRLKDEAIKELIVASDGYKTPLDGDQFSSWFSHNCRSWKAQGILGPVIKIIEDDCRKAYNRGRTDQRRIHRNEQ